MKFQAIVDLTEQNGNSPLWRGLFDEVDEEINIVLLKYGANINLENKHQVAPREFLEVNVTTVQKWLSENKK